MTYIVVQEDGAARTQKKRMSEDKDKKRPRRQQKAICSFLGPFCRTLCNAVTHIHIFLLLPFCICAPIFFLVFVVGKSQSFAKY